MLYRSYKLLYIAFFMRTGEESNNSSSPLDLGTSRSVVLQQAGNPTKKNVLDLGECFHKGSIGALGAIPGTMLAHPFDVMKIRMQVSGQPLNATFRGLLYKKSAFFAGVVPGVQQKVVTRGPMFFASEVSTQLCEQHLGMSRTLASFVGSFASGFFTGALGTIPEYRKVLISQNISTTANSMSYMSILNTIRSSQNGVSLWRRIRSAGIRNGIFDSTFFGVQHVLSERGMSGPWSYGSAAISALVLDYVFDVATKRMLAVPPEVRVDGLFVQLKSILGVGKRHLAFRGLSVKGAEFWVSYSITGAVSLLVMDALRQ